MLPDALPPVAVLALSALADALRAHDWPGALALALGALSLAD